FYPVITGNLVDDYIPNHNMDMILFLLALMLGFYILKAGAKYVVIYFGHMLGVKIQSDMRREVFEKLQTLPFSYYDNNKTGVIMSRIINDTMDISEFTHHGPEEIFLSAVMLGGSFIILSQSSLPLTLILFAVIPLIAFVSIRKKKKMKETFTETRKDTGIMNADLENSIAGLRVSRAFGGDTHDIERFGKSNDRYYDSRTRSYRAMAEYHSWSHFLTDLLFLVGMGATGFFAYYGWISTGDLVTFLLYITLFMNAIRRLIDFAEMYEMGMTGFARFTELMDTPSEEEAADAAAITHCDGNITLDKVSFTYEENEAVLSNVSLSIESGQKVAIVGPSGSGKTTLCHLIPRFYEVTSGRILLDGKDITTLTRRSLREQIGIVQQDVFLFTGTIGENIAYGNFGATQKEIEEAARRANIHDFILEQPQGYATEVGERGVKLSGGQKQRIAIARAFLKNPPILILDEATSALDNVTELAIQQSLDTLCRGRTTLIVAHRLSTIRGADKIVVLTEQGVEEEGSHQELMALDGIYARLYTTQFRIDNGGLGDE
ncbi:MAG: ABC transporter ATP-binding protein, partial [Angelakisella sp.]